jgi:hypothetical protein
MGHSNISSRSVGDMLMVSAHVAAVISADLVAGVVACVTPEWVVCSIGELCGGKYRSQYLGFVAHL